MFFTVWYSFCSLGLNKHVKNVLIYLYYILYVPGSGVIDNFWFSPQGISLL